jgi:molybdopterin-guanine dinucleotide biosynthesis protein A
VEKIDAVVLAAGRFAAPEARRAGAAIKALVNVAGTTPFEAVVTALRSSEAIDRVIVVAPLELHGSSRAVDAWVDERATGEDNVLAGLASARSRRTVLSASDLPFVRSAHVDDLLGRVPHDADFAYPVYEMAEFLAAFPRGRTRFARVGRKHYTGGSMCVVNVRLALAQAPLIRQGFAARKSQLAMASLLGVTGLVRFVTGSLAIEHVERRLFQLTGGRAVAVRGAHPALAMDCDSAQEVEYARAHHVRIRGE